jgi:glycosyltransferase involved in cell wall biosynthesis
VPYKGHKYLFRALPELLRRFPDLKLVVVGRFSRKENCTRQLRMFQLKQGLVRRVKWLGRRDNMHQVMAALDVVVIPSLVESMGMVALEAMAAGTPVVAARTGGLNELIVDGKNGLLVNRKDPESLAAAVSLALSNSELAEQLAKEGRQWVADQFSPDRMTEKIETIYREVSDCRNRQRNAAA